MQQYTLTTVYLPKMGGNQCYFTESEGLQMENTQSDILTVDEAAELLKIPRSSVYKLAQQKRIPAQKVGRHWRFHRETLINWIAGKPVSGIRQTISIDS
jgi:excisionase family DNA binding protein